MFNWTQQLSLVSWFICSRIWPRQARGGKGCGFLRLQPLEAEDGYRLWTAWLWVIDPTSSIRRLPVGSPILCAGRRKTDRRFAPALSLGWTTTASADTNHTGSGAATFAPGRHRTRTMPGGEDASPTEGIAAATSTGRMEVNTATSNHLANLVPTFDPAKDDLDQYTQKVELLSEIWPQGKINELLARLILGTTGSAFQKLQLNKTKIMSNDTAGVQLLVSLLGGQWGKVNLEKKYDIVEKALYRCIQKQDESNDSFLARCDVVWTELLSKGVTLAEIQSYIVLRGSLLASDDKKRVIMECNTAGTGVLTMTKVSESIRMLGTHFFHEMIGQRKQKGKIYESQTLLVEDEGDHEEFEAPAFVADELTEEEFLEQLLHADDEDAALVADYEAAMADTVQSDQELASAYNTYSEARRRLSERFRHRGFWPIAPSAAKGKGKGFKGKGKSDRYAGLGKGQKKSLQQRILESTCRACGKKGHWKAECPDRFKNAQSGSNTSGTSAAMTVAAVPHHGPAEPNGLPIEFMKLPTITEPSLDEPRMQEIHFVSSLSTELRDRIRIRGNRSNLHQTTSPKPLRNEFRSASQATNPYAHEAEEAVYFSTQGTCGILDTGATKSVIGSKLLPSLLESLPDQIRNQLSRTTCAITFRFGNQGTLDSQQALVIPFKSIGLGLKIAIVPGETPLLLSNTLVRTLKASIDSDRECLSSQFFKHPVKLQLSPRGLYMLDLNDLLEAQRDTRSRSKSVLAETFASSDFSTCKSVHEADASEAIMPDHLHAPECSHQYNKDGKHVIHVQGRESNVVNGTCTEPLAKTSCSECVATRPKDLSPQFLAWVGKTNQLPLNHHEPFEPLGTCPQSRSLRPIGGIQDPDASADGTTQDHVRKSSHQQDLLRGVDERENMGEMVSGSICPQRQTRAQEVPDLCGTDDRVSRELSGRSQPSGTSSNHATSVQSKCQEQGYASSPTTRDSCGGTGGARRSGIRALGSSRTIEPANLQQCGPHRDPSLAEPSLVHGECSERDSGAPATECPVSVDQQTAWLLQAGDFDHDFEEINSMQTIPNHFIKQFHQLVKQISKELQQSKQKYQSIYQPINLLEVFCSPQSELTKQTNQMGYRAVRFGYNQGDLSTPEGRDQLFKMLLERDPQNIWFSPTCGPWCSWSILNEARTEAGFQTIQENRVKVLCQLALGLVLFRFQMSCGRHMHWEQPKRSLMLRNPFMHEVIQNTLLAEFDMCRVGAMRDPQNQLLYQKGMELATTSTSLYESLHGRKCNHTHQHQQLAGDIYIKGVRVKRTEISENYTRKFARHIAQVITKLRTIREVAYDTAFVQISKRTCRSGNLPQPKRARLPQVNIRLMPPSDMPVKRRRLNEKTTSENHKLCQDVVDRVLKIAPRVGKKEINDPDIHNQIQEIFHDKQVVRIMACRGTERTVTPPKDLISGEAPFRRAIIVQRKTLKVFVEDQWEEWPDLSGRMLWRRSHPSYLNITVFARNHQTLESVPRPAQTMSETVTPDQSQIPEGSTVTPDERPPIPTSQVPATEPSRPNFIATPSPLDINTPSQIDEYSNYHGPRFLAMSNDDRKLALRLHKNLGHPDPQRLSQVLKQQGYGAELCQGVLDLKCSVCQMQKRPTLQRPATLKPELDFGDRIAMDGVKWTSRTGKEFHFYHVIDYGTNYHVAMAAPNRADVQEKFVNGWLSWAGSPNEIVLDSAGEFVSEAFSQFLQNLNIKCTVVPKGAHWQMGRIERHGGVIQEMLSKYELEQDVSTYQQFQQALIQCTMAKNSCSTRFGYTPETVVFGKGLRLPGSVVGDDSLPAHAIAAEDSGRGIRFRELLSMRESARKAFHAADNSMSLRRAALRRDRPGRAAYQPGEWVMVWRSSVNKSSWIGPAKVIQQDGNTTVFCNNMGNIIKAAPEHVRPVSAVESLLIPSTLMNNPETSTEGTPQVQLNQTAIVPEQTTNVPSENTSTENNQPPPQPSSQSSEQPDQEPAGGETPREPIETETTTSHPETSNIHQETNPNTNPNNQDSSPNTEPYQIPVPEETSDELLCDLLTCVDEGEHSLVHLTFDSLVHLTFASPVHWPCWHATQKK